MSELIPTPNPLENSHVPTGGNKGIIIAGILVIIAIAFGIFALLSYKSADQYQGMIKKIETQTEELQQAQDKLRR